jgi:hypothetical protein
MLVDPDPMFYGVRDQLVALATRYAVPTREHVAPGRLISYAADIPDALRLVGIYTGRILKGEKPADLPVQRSTKVVLAINLKTAKALGLTIPETLLATGHQPQDRQGARPHHPGNAVDNRRRGDPVAVSGMVIVAARGAPSTHIVPTAALHHFSGGMSELGQNRPTSSTLECLLSPGPDMFREKTPMLGRTFRLDTSAGFGKRASMRFPAPTRPMPVAGLALQLSFCFEVRALSDRLVSSTPE